LPRWPYFFGKTHGAADPTKQYVAAEPAAASIESAKQSGWEKLIWIGKAGDTINKWIGRSLDNTLTKWSNDYFRKPFWF